MDTPWQDDSQPAPEEGPPLHRGRGRCREVFLPPLNFLGTVFHRFWGYFLLCNQLLFGWFTSASEEDGKGKKKGWGREGGGRGDNGWTQICSNRSKIHSIGNNHVWNLDSFHQCKCSGILCDIPLKSNILVPINWNGLGSWSDHA